MDKSHLNTGINETLNSTFTPEYSMTEPTINKSPANKANLKSIRDILQSTEK